MHSKYNTYKTYGINRKYDFTAIVKRNIKYKFFSEKIIFNVFFNLPRVHAIVYFCTEIKINA